VTTATAFSAGASDTIAAGEWAAAAKLAENGVDGTNGTNGTNGLSSAVVYIYQRAASAPTVPSSTATYTFATKSLTGINNGWSTTIPAGSNPLYVTAATASSSGATDTIATGEWSAPVVLAQNGAGGVAGATGIGLYIYQRAATAPALPSTTATYTFATASLTGLNNGWVTSVPSGTNPLWVSTATALSTGATDSIAPAEWATVSKLAENGTNGTNGADGSSVYTATAYILADAAVSAPTGGSFNFATATLTPPAGWSAAALSPVAGQLLYTSTFTFTGSPTATVAGGTWTAPVASSPAGVVNPGPTASHFASRLGGTATAGVTFRPDGNIAQRVSGSSASLVNVLKWFLPTGGTPGNGYWIRYSLVSLDVLLGSPTVGGASGTLQQLNTNREVTLALPVSSSAIAQIRYQIYSDSLGASLVSSGAIFLEGESEP
jgi:hypothetical protein